MEDRIMTKQRRASTARRVAVQSLRLNVLILILDLAILAIYSLLKGETFSALLDGSLEFLLLLEAGLLLLGGGAYVATSGISFGKFRERVFHSEGWSHEEYKRSEIRALPWVVTGVLVLAESLMLALA
jgi:hypothetical protein